MLQGWTDYAACKVSSKLAGRPLYACSAAVPGAIPADDNVACVPTCVDGARDDRRDQGELDGRGVDDADGVARAGALEDAKERPGWETQTQTQRLQGGTAGPERP